MAHRPCRTGIRRKGAAAVIVLTLCATAARGTPGGTESIRTERATHDDVPEAGAPRATAPPTDQDEDGPAPPAATLSAADAPPPDRSPLDESPGRDDASATRVVAVQPAQSKADTPDSTGQPAPVLPFSFPGTHLHTVHADDTSVTFVISFVSRPTPSQFCETVETALTNGGAGVSTRCTAEAPFVTGNYAGRTLRLAATSRDTFTLSIRAAST